MPFRPVVEVAPDTCSECSGPLDEEAGYSPAGARCRTCCDREADAEAARERIEAKKAYAGNVRAEERAIDTQPALAVRPDTSGGSRL